MYQLVETKLNIWLKKFIINLGNKKFNRNFHQGNPQMLALEQNYDSINVNVLKSEIKTLCPFLDLSLLILNPIGDNRPHAEVTNLGEKISGL